MFKAVLPPRGQICSCILLTIKNAIHKSDCIYFIWIGLIEYLLIIMFIVNSILSYAGQLKFVSAHLLQDAAHSRIFQQVILNRSFWGIADVLVREALYRINLQTCIAHYVLHIWAHSVWYIGYFGNAAMLI